MVPEDRTDGCNLALHALLGEAGMSNAALARAVVAAGAEEGMHVGTNTTSVRRMLDGSQPRWPVPRLVAKALSRRLGYQVSVTQCGFADRAVAADTFDAFQRAPTIDGTIGTVVELSGRDIQRRNFLIGSAFAAGAFAQPAWLAMTLPAEPVAAKAAGPRIGTTDVHIVLDTVRHFEQLHRRFGGGVVRQQIVHFVHQQAHAARHGSYRDSVGRELFRALAQATWLAGLVSMDSGRHALGQRYYTQAVHLAMQTGDRLFAANVLAEMSSVTVDIGNTAGDQVTARQCGQHAAALGSSALQVADRAKTPAFGAWLNAMHARGLAMLGDARAAAHALDEAQRSFEKPSHAEPDWFRFYGEPDLLADIGLCLRDTGRPRQGLALLERAADSLPADRVTARAKTQIHIAAAHLEVGEFEAADSTTARALDAIEELSSHRIVDRVRALRHRARRHGGHRQPLTMDERITAFLTAARSR